MKGCTARALEEVAGALQQCGIETEMFWIGAKPITGCVACHQCETLGECTFGNDRVNLFIEKADEADGFVFGTPVYYASPSGQLLSFMDRAFYAGGAHLAYKPAAAISSSRRAGGPATMDVLNKYFTINNMPVVSSQYWNEVHGFTPEQVEQDLEGMQTMRTLGRNMAWLLRCIEAGQKQGIEPPADAEEHQWTNFIK